MLTKQERQIVKRDILFWHERKWHVHALTVMPDHVHVLAAPLPQSEETWHSLSEVLHSVKRGSALKINGLRHTRGALWQSESFDRIVRNAREFRQKFNYILGNAAKHGLVKDGWEYDGFWCGNMENASADLQRERASGTCSPPRRPKGVAPDTLVIRRRRKLPHWELAGATYFITFRLKRS